MAMEKNGTPEHKGDCSKCPRAGVTVIPVKANSGVKDLCEHCFKESEKKAAANPQKTQR